MCFGVVDKVLWWRNEIFGFVKSRVLTRLGFVYVKGVWVLLWCFVFCRVLSGAREVLSDRGRERESKGWVQYLVRICVCRDFHVWLGDLCVVGLSQGYYKQG